MTLEFFIMTSPLLITPAALQWFLKIRPEPHSILCFGMKKMGCAGYEYALDWTSDASVTPLYTSGHLSYWIDPEHVSSYQNTEIDIVRQHLGTQVVYRNPNVVDHCGCGMSMSFESREP